jgi:hypothetical protein
MHLMAYFYDWGNDNNIDPDEAKKITAEIEEEVQFLAELNVEQLMVLRDSQNFDDWRAGRIRDHAIGSIKTRQSLGTLTLDALSNLADSALKERDQEKADDCFKVLTGNEVAVLEKSELPALIARVLPINGIMTISGPAKMGKSVVALNAIMSLSAVMPWLGFKTRPCLSVYGNFELAPEDTAFRINAICAAAGITIEKIENRFSCVNINRAKLLVESIDFVNPTKNKFAFLRYFLKRLEARFEHEFRRMISINPQAANHPRLIILDSFYNLCFGDINENDVNDVSTIYGLIRAMAQNLNTAGMLIHHFSKGNPGQKMKGELAAGSRAHRQEPDAYMELVPLAEEKCYVADFNLRSYRDIPSFGTRFLFPLLTRDDTVDVSKLSKPGRPTMNHEPVMLSALSDKPISRLEWMKAVAELGTVIPTTSFDRAKDGLIVTGKVVLVSKNKYVKGVPT